MPTSIMATGVFLMFCGSKPGVVDIFQAEDTLVKRDGAGASDYTAHGTGWMRLSAVSASV